MVVIRPRETRPRGRSERSTWPHRTPTALVPNVPTVPIVPALRYGPCGLLRTALRYGPLAYSGPTDFSNSVQGLTAVQRLSPVQGSRVQKFNVPDTPQASYRRRTNTSTNHEHGLWNFRNFEMRNRIARQSRRGNAPARSSGLPQGADGHGVKLIAKTYAHLAIVQHQAGGQRQQPGQSIEGADARQVADIALHERIDIVAIPRRPVPRRGLCGVRSPPRFHIVDY
jgi:hypothetical protein